MSRTIAEIMDNDRFGGTVTKGDRVRLDRFNARFEANKRAAWLDEDQAFAEVRWLEDERKKEQAQARQRKVSAEVQMSLASEGIARVAAASFGR